jgi:hypothetical protein
MMTAGTHSVEAYQHYLNGLALDYEYGETGDPDNLLAAYEAFEKARTIDPSFANAHWEAANFRIGTGPGHAVAVPVGPGRRTF